MNSRMMNFQMRLVLLVGLSFFAQLSLAAELIESFRAVRALGMGNAYTAIVDDSDSLFYNPAGLGKASGYYWTIVDPWIGLNGAEVLQTVQEVQAAADQAEMLDALYGRPIWIGAGGKTALRLDGIAIAGFMGGELSTYLSNPVYPSMNVHFLNDTGFSLGTGVNLNFAQFGVGVRRIMRTGADVPLGPALVGEFDSGTLSSSLANKGTGYGLDLGLNLVAPTPIQPTLSLVWKNVGSTSFTQDSGVAKPPMIRDEVIVGYGMTFSSLLLDIHTAIDYKYANRYDEQIGKKVHMGIEFSFPFFDLRAGFHQGYHTYGLGLDMGFVRFDLASYGVELGEYPGQKQDRRYAAQMIMEFGFDMGFDIFGGSGGSGGKSRRLKQRR